MMKNSYEGFNTNSTLIFIILFLKSQVASLQGVQGVHETNFWTLCTNVYVGGVKIEVSRDADPKYVVTHTQLIFRAVGVTQLYVQLDYEQSTSTYKNLQNPNFY